MASRTAVRDDDERGEGGARPLITFDRRPADYRHWRVLIDGRIATLFMEVDPEHPIAPGYKLKLNSYDLGVDIELNDILQRLRFEQPGVGCVVITSGLERTFCSGANIYMLGLSSHSWKVNFCKFTNETRNGFEDSSANSSLKFLAAINGACAGGGYEIALACDEILLVDDRSSAVSVPEVSLLAVLPGTGGLTRITDKRMVRRDLADVFCTSQEGARGHRAKKWKLVDDIAAPGVWEHSVRARAERLAKKSRRPGKADGVELKPLKRQIDAQGYHYPHVDVRFDRKRRFATILLRAPTNAPPCGGQAMRKQGSAFWPLALARELDDAILMLRTNEPELGLWVLETEGNGATVLAYDAAMIEAREHWFVIETIGMIRRTFARLEVSSRSLYAIAGSGSAFWGMLAELLFAADRSYMLALLSDPDLGPMIALSRLNFGMLPMVNGRGRLESRYPWPTGDYDHLRDRIGSPMSSDEALAYGLVTFAPDEIDWDEEIRLAIDERAQLSADALTGMESNLRFGGHETMASKIFGRLSAWQNWIFNRPNAAGSTGALRLFGTGRMPSFDIERV